MSPTPYSRRKRPLLNTSVDADLFRELHAAGQTIILVTHDTHVAATAQRQIRMQDGRVMAPTPA